MPFVVLIVVVVLWTGPWSPLPKVSWFKARSSPASPDARRSTTIAAASTSRPSSAARAILASWIIVALAACGAERRAARRDLPHRPSTQMWGALLVGVFIFGLAYVFNYSGMAASLANGFSKIGTGLHHRRADPRLHRRRAVRQQHLDQRDVRQVPGAGRRAARLAAAAAADAQFGRRRDRQAGRAADRERRRLDQRFVRNEGDVIRHNMGWTFVLLAYLIVIGVGVLSLLPRYRRSAQGVSLRVYGFNLRHQSRMEKAAQCFVTCAETSIYSLRGSERAARICVGDCLGVVSGRKAGHSAARR